MADIDITALTKDAESGRCIAESLKSVDFVESLKTLRQIENQNARNRASDPSLPELVVARSMEPASFDLTMRRKEPSWYRYQDVLSDKLLTNNATAGIHTVTCLDK